MSSCELLSLNIGSCKVKSRQQVRRIRSEQSDDSDEFRPGNVVESSDDSTSEVRLGHNILRNTVVPSSHIFESWSCCAADVANGEREAGIHVVKLAVTALNTVPAVVCTAAPGGALRTIATDLDATSLAG